MKETDLAYIAGFFDGEGSVSLFFPRGGKNGKRYPRLEARIAQNDRAVLEWIRSEVGYGRVYSKYDGRGCSYFVVVCRQARAFLALIRPYLKVKALDVDERLAAEAELVTARPTKPPWSSGP